MLRSIGFICLSVFSLLFEAKANSNVGMGSPAKTEKEITEVDFNQLMHINSQPEAETAARDIAQSFPKKLIKSEKKELQAIIEDSLKLQGSTSDLSNSCSSCRNNNFLKEIKIEKQENIDHKEKLLVFVSSNISEESLKALFLQAQRLGVSIIFRGLIENSFQKTKDFFEKLEINAEINPILFDEYKIIHVPTFVLAEGDKHDLVQGNISLAEALRIIHQKGQLKKQAKHLLYQIEGFNK